MKKKVISLLVCFTMIFTMAIPAYADTVINLRSPLSKTAYLAIGDSIGAGCRNSDYGYGMNYINSQYSDDEFADYRKYNEQFIDFNNFYNSEEGVGIKKHDVYAVDFAYVSKIAKAINADKESSFNGTYNGLRSKDMCNILGIAPLKEGDYSPENDFWRLSMDMATTGQFEFFVANEEDIEYYQNSGYYPNYYEDYCLKKMENSKLYKEAIATADVITVELGMNDLSALLSNLMMNPTLIEEIMSGIEGLSGTGEIFERFKEDVANLTKGNESYCDFIGKLRVLESDLNELQEFGANIKGLIGNITSILDELLAQNLYYFTNLMNYINEHKKPGAIVVAATMVNPVDGTEGVGEIVGLFINGINTLIKSEALKYDYVVADIFGVEEIDLSPEPDVIRNSEGEELGRIGYVLHPNEKGQDKIAEIFAKEIVLAPVTDFVNDTTKTVVVGLAAEAILSKVIDDDSSKTALLNAAKSIADNTKALFNKSRKSKEKATAAVTEEPKTEVQKQEEPIEATQPAAAKLTEEEVINMVNNASLRCSTEKTAKGIKVTAKVEDIDLDTISDGEYTITYKFYRSTKKSSGYKYMLTSKTGKYTNTSVKKGNKYYYKTVMVVTDEEGNEVTSSVLKNCKYGTRTF